MNATNAKAIAKAISLSAALAAPAVFGTPAATEDWVRHYVATTTVQGVTEVTDITQTISTNTGVATLSYTNTDGRVITMTRNMHYKLALTVTNCTVAATALGVTNGTLFAFNGSNEYWNAGLGLSISATTNCFRFNGVNSHTNASGTADVVDGYFWIMGTRIDKPTYDALLPATTAQVRAREPMIWRVLAAIGDLIVPTARAADTWGEVAGWSYTPVAQGANQDANGSLNVYDTKGNSATLEYENGVVTQASLENAINVLSLNVKSVFANCATLGGDILKLDQSLAKLDTQLQDLKEKLDGAFVRIFGKMAKIEKEIKTPTANGGTKTTKQTLTILNKTENYITLADPNSLAALNVDGKSISVKGEGTANAAYQLYGFDKVKNVEEYPIPFINAGSIAWGHIGFWGDDKSIGRTDAEGDVYTTIGIKGWKSQANCGETLSKMLTDPSDVHRTDHHILCRYCTSTDGDYSSAVIHYLPLGDVISGMAPDGVTIVTNATGHVGQFSIAGALTADAGTVLTATGGGVTWAAAGGGGVEFDGASIVTNAATGKVEIKGYAAATDIGSYFAVPIKEANGLTWKKAEAFDEVDVITDVTYSNNKLTIKKRKVRVLHADDEGSPEEVFTAVEIPAL